VFDRELLSQAYQKLPHGEKLRVISRLIHLTPHDIQCEIAPQSDNPLWEDSNRVSSFSCIEYAAQAAALHGIYLGVEYNPLRPAFVAAIKDLQIEQADYPNNQTVTLVAEQEFNAPDGAIYQFNAAINGVRIMRGRLILKK
jgi:predicted hotdog family 3-hydroxylacyl-ACP dehydratase